MGCVKNNNECPDPSLPTVDESSMECCELTPTNCVITSEYQDFFKIGKGKTLTYVLGVIAKFVKKNKGDIDDLKLLHNYKEYTAKLTQALAVEPTSVEVVNELVPPVVYSYTSAGKYLLTSTGAFPDEDKVVITLGTFNKVWGADVKAYWVDANSIAIESGNTTDYIDDSIITNMPISIKVYN